MSVNSERCVQCFAEYVATSTGCPVCGTDTQSVFDGAVSAISLRAGTVLHQQYVVGRVLGQGGFGITYLGWDRDLKLKVAIKEYFPTLWASRDPATSAVSVHSAEAAESFRNGLDRFLEEGQTLARFNEHPGIVSVLRFFRENSTGYLVMAYIEGVTLKDYVKQQGGSIPADAAVRVLLPIMDALCEVHDAGVLHRDISPDNIYITRAGQVKLLDFGAARTALGEEQRSLSVIYKPGFAPPEQYMSQGKQGRWTDVYALAATLYLCITGKIPQPSVERLHDDKLLPPSALQKAIDPTVEAALMRGLSVSYLDRFQSMREFQSALYAEGSAAAPEDSGRTNVRIPAAVRGAAEPTPSDWMPSLQRARLKWAIGGFLALLVVFSVLRSGGVNAPVFDSRLQGRWMVTESAVSVSPLVTTWSVDGEGRYSIEYSVQDTGVISSTADSSDNGRWSAVSTSKRPIGPGEIVFEDPNTIRITGLSPWGGPSVTLTRRGVRGVRAGDVPRSLIGSWEQPLHLQGISGNLLFIVDENGAYQLSVMARGSGSIEARGGLYRIRSADGEEANGSYAVLDSAGAASPERPVRIQLTGRGTPTFIWERVLESSES